MPHGSTSAWSVCANFVLKIRTGFYICVYKIPIRKEKKKKKNWRNITQVRQTSISDRPGTAPATQGSGVGVIKSAQGNAQRTHTHKRNKQSLLCCSDPNSNNSNALNGFGCPEMLLTRRCCSCCCCWRCWLNPLALLRCFPWQLLPEILIKINQLNVGFMLNAHDSHAQKHKNRKCGETKQQQKQNLRTRAYRRRQCWSVYILEKYAWAFFRMYS